MIPNIYREGYTSDEEVERVIQIGKISGRVFFERTNLGGSIQGTGDLRGRRSSGQDGRSPRAWRNTWTHVDQRKLERLDTSSSPLSSMVMESTSPLFHRTCSCQRACRLVGSSTSEAISGRRAQSRQSLRTLSNPWLRPSSCRRTSQVIAGPSCIKRVHGAQNLRLTLEIIIINQIYLKRNRTIIW